MRPLLFAGAAAAVLLTPALLAFADGVSAVVPGSAGSQIVVGGDGSLAWMSPEQWYGYVCGDDGAVLKWLVRALYAVGLASVLGNFRNMLPPAVVKAIDVVGLNFIKAAPTLAKTVAIFMVVAIAACSSGLSPVAAPPVPPVSASGAAVPAPTPADPLAQLAAFTVADLTAADSDAVTNGDAIAHACYPALIAFVQGQAGNASLTVKGAISAFQRARDLANGVQAGLPVALRLGCSALVLDTQELVAKLAALGVGSAATAGAILPVPVLP